jgi:multidrug transporter EmrE-like cation transporter
VCPYGYVGLTVALTVYGQLVTKWSVMRAGELPRGRIPRLRRLVRLLFDPWVLSGMVAAAVAGVAWLAALDELELSVAYPFVAATFALVVLLSSRLFGEPMTRDKVLGVGLICAGLVIANVA